jgi:dethiobiotin synthetase
MNYFITATDTAAGKTYVTALLIRALRNLGHKSVAIKPIACGSLDDSKKLQAAANHEISLEDITPFYYKAPLSPFHAAEAEGKNFSMNHILSSLSHLQKKHISLLVEGVGGWLVLLSPTESIADLARATQLPILLVVRNRLGSMNHTLLTLESIKYHGCRCAGILLNHHPEDHEDQAREKYRKFFRELCKKRELPVFLEIEPGQEELILSPDHPLVHLEQ